ncbi:MAG: hypothetical protein R3F61_25815 [Myxococcota bacterium]
MILIATLLGCTSGPATDTGEVEGTAETGGPARREWVDVTPYPCGVDADGWVECWHSNRWSSISPDHVLFLTVPPSPFATRLRDIVVGGLAWGVPADGSRPRNWHCAGEYGDGEAWCQAPPPVDFDMIGTECGLADGEVYCWGGLASAPFPNDRTYRLFHGPYSGAYAALTTENEIVIRGGTEEPEYQLDPGLEVDTLVSFDVSGACVLTSTGEVHCMGPGWVPEFTNPPYQRLDGGFRSVCAVRQDWVIECGDGSTFDFGPIRALSVYSHEHWDPIVPPPAFGGPAYTRVLAEVSDPPHVCAITEDNAVHCVGWRYEFDDLQDQLPKGDGPQ